MLLHLPIVSTYCIYLLYLLPIIPTYRTNYIPIVVSHDVREMSLNNLPQSPLGTESLMSLRFIYSYSETPSPSISTTTDIICTISSLCIIILEGTLSIEECCQITSSAYGNRLGV